MTHQKNQPGNYLSLKDMVDDVTQTYGEYDAYQWFDQEELHTKTYSMFRQDMDNPLACLDWDTTNPSEKHHVGLLGDNSYGWATAYLSILYSRHILVPFDRDLPPASLAGILNLADLDTLVVSSSHIERIRPLFPDLKVRRILLMEQNGDELRFIQELVHTAHKADTSHDPDGLKLIMFTSGTTSTSKGVMLREQNLLASVRGTQAHGGVPPFSRVYTVLPMYHIFSSVGDIVRAFYVAGTLCINTNPRRIAQEFRAFNPHSVKVVPLVAAGLIRMAMLAVKNGQLERMADFFGDSLLSVVCGGAAVPQKVVEAYAQAGVELVRGYGLTECAATVIGTAFGEPCPDGLTVGTPLSCNEIRIVDGEIQIKGENVMIGYYKNPEATRDAFDGEWLRSGDLGYIENEFVYVTGRCKNIIVLSNGKNIYPEEIEEYFAEIPGIDEMVVLEWNFMEKETLLAAIIYTEDGNADDITAQMQQVNQMLPAYKQVIKTFFTSSPLDKTTTRKFLRTKAKARAIRESIFTRLKEVLAEVAYLDEVRETSDLLLDLQLDSFAILDFIARCEAHFDVTIRDGEIPKLRNISNIIDLIAERAGQNLQPVGVSS